MKIFFDLNKFKILVSLVVLIFCIFCGVVNAESCNNKVATDKSSCNSITPVNGNNKCCYLENLNNSSIKLCLEIPTNSITKSTLYRYNNQIYSITCPNIPAVEILPLCGANNVIPLGKTDCSVYSSFAKSCCFNKNRKICNLLDTKYSGEIEYALQSLDCSGWKLKLTYGFILIIVNALFFI